MSSSEIITNIDNSIYHLHLKPGQLSTDIILVGDPDRVDSISKYFDTIEFVIQNREFKSVTGSFNNKRISVISTGIGGSNIDIGGSTDITLITPKGSIKVKRIVAREVNWAGAVFANTSVPSSALTGI